MELTLSFYALAASVVLLTGISKGGFAGGLGTLAVPLLTLVIDPRTAAAIMLPILICMDFFSVAAHRRHYDKQILKILVPAAILGIVIGTFSFRLFSADLIRLMVGLLAIYFVGHYLYGLWRKSRQSDSRPIPSTWKGRLWGCLGGFTSFVAHAGGPPLSIYLLPLKLEKSVLVGTSVFFFTTVNLVKLIPYAWLGQLNTDNLLTSLYLLPLAPIGVKLGVYLHHRVSERWFYWLCYSLLGAAGLKLVYEGATGVL